jgi:LPXTG-site transpeptidase (sortase) family protein
MKRNRIIIGSVAIGIGLFLLLSIPNFFFTSHQNETKLLYDYNQKVSVKATKEETPQKPLVQKVSNEANGGAIGKITIQSLSLEVPIVEGTDSTSLTKGAGHLSTSVQPGEKGTSILAAHNITFFHTIGHLKVNDSIQVETQTGTHNFRVYDTKIVHIGDPVYQTETPSLILETCYPFDSLQRTPERYLVYASIQS